MPPSSTQPIRVLALTRHAEQGSSSRLRMMQYAPALADQNIKLDIAPMLDDAYLNALYQGTGRHRLPGLLSYPRRLQQMVSAGQYDVLWIEKELLPWLPAWLERRLLRGQRFVLDYDDATFHRYDQHPSTWVRRLLGNKIQRLIAQADAVIVGNAYLAQYAQQAGAQHILQLPTVVNLTDYPLVPYPDGPPRIGWIGSPATEAYLTLIAAPLAAVCQQTGAYLRVIGTSEGFSLPDVPTERFAWSSQTEGALLSACHVGIMPLPDDDWAEGKCGFKLVQYMAVARPVVATPIGINQQLVQPGINGYLASTAEGWQAALLDLIQHPALAEKQGLAGRHQVAQHYSLAVAAPQVAQILRAVAQD